MKKTDSIRENKEAETNAYIVSEEKLMTSREAMFLK